MLMGAAYQSYFPSWSSERISYVAETTDAPFFEGTGYKKGDQSAAVVGYEWDNTDPEGDGRRLWVEGKSTLPRIDPDSIKVLFSAQPIDKNGKQGRADAVYFVSKGGAKVFDAGSIHWAWGLGKDGFEDKRFKVFNHNLIMDFLDKR
jgi:hypothetical protein